MLNAIFELVNKKLKNEVKRRGGEREALVEAAPARVTPGPTAPHFLRRQPLPRASSWRSGHDAPHHPLLTQPPPLQLTFFTLLFYVVPPPRTPPHTAGRTAGPRLQRRSAANSSTPSFARLVRNVPHPLRSTSSPHVISARISLRDDTHRIGTPGTHCCSHRAPRAWRR